MGDGERGTLPHHRLRVWHRAMCLVQVCVERPPEDTELRNQALRAVKSVALNIAEGAPLQGRARKRFFQTARASVVEVTAAYELAHAIGENTPVIDVTQRANEIFAMLTKLMRTTP